MLGEHKGEFNKYMGSKITIIHESNGLGILKFPALVHKLVKDYKSPGRPVSKTPAVAGQVLMKCDGDWAVAEA